MEKYKLEWNFFATCFAWWIYLESRNIDWIYRMLFLWCLEDAGNSAEKKQTSQIFKKSIISWTRLFTACKVSKYGVISGPNVGKYEPEITPYLDNFHAVIQMESNDREQIGNK